jgi:hypothetical protein
MKCRSHSALVFIGLVVTCAAVMVGHSVLQTLHKFEFGSVLPRPACLQDEAQRSEWQHVDESAPPGLQKRSATDQWSSRKCDN